MKGEIQVAPDPATLYESAANELARAATRAVDGKGSFTLALAGGSTPHGMYSLLVANRDILSRFPWGKTYFFWTDERHVAPDHSDSNYRMAWDAFLSKAPIDRNNVHRIQGERQDLKSAAVDYERRLREVFQSGNGEIPRFDFVMLGLGPDGHTASLFPGTEALKETKRLIVSNWVPKLAAGRITMTPPLLNNAEFVMFLACGADKAGTLKRVLEGPVEPEQLPAQLLQPYAGRLLWLVDQAAAGLLTRLGKKELI